MKLLSVASAVSLLALSTAETAVENKQVKDVWHVTSLSAGAEPHGTNSHFGLVIQTEPGSVNASCTGTGNTYQALGSLKRTACKPTSVDFSWASRPDGGATLTVWRRVSPLSWYHGSHDIPADQIVWTNLENPTGKIQVYAGPEKFSIDNIKHGNGTAGTP